MSSYRRITVTVPEQVLRAADAAAKRLDRSRSWVVAEALRRYVVSAGEDRVAEPRGGAVREPPASPYDVQKAFRAAELSRLIGDLALTPEQRVRLAEELARTGPSDRPRPRFRRGWLADTCGRLNHHEARYVLVGGFAVQLWGAARATRDIDILIEPTVDNAARVLDALSREGGWPARTLTAQEVASAAVTVVGDIPRVDIMTVAWRVRYEEAIAAARVFEVEGVRIPTASLEHLIESKRTGRLQDAADIEVLEEIRRLRGESSP